ncbi:MAG: hypothetical protein ACK6DS_20135 [Planctomycetota bacterium]
MNFGLTAGKQIGDNRAKWTEPTMRPPRALSLALRLNQEELLMAVMENVKVVNSLVRTVLLLGAVGGLGYAGWYGYENYVVPAQQAKIALAELESMQTRFTALEKDFKLQEAELAKAKLENEKLQTSLKLLKIDRRLANVKVLEKGTSAAGEPFLEVEFVEVNKEGKPVGEPRQFKLRGDKLYVDCWLVKFEDQYIEQADALRSASLCVFRSIWGDLDGPNGGHSLDRQGEGVTAPGIYASFADANPFEAQIWQDFWTVANDPQKQKGLGIRANHGQVNYVLVEPGQVYQIEARASDGVSIRPLEKSPAE